MHGTRLPDSMIEKDDLRMNATLLCLNIAHTYACRTETVRLQTIDAAVVHNSVW